MQLNEINYQVLDFFADNINYFLFWKDTKGVFIGCNQKLADLLEIGDKKNIIGLTDYDIHSEKEESDYYRMIDQRVMDTGNPEVDFEEVQTQKDGSIKWLQTTKYPLLDSNNNVIGTLGWFSDITDIKRMQTNLNENSKIIYNNNIALKKLNNQLEISNLDLEKFTYAASHDLKNPLRIIQLSIELIELKNSNHFNDESQKLFKEIKKSAKAMSELIFNILDYAKTGSAHVEFEKSDLKELVNQKLFLLKNVIQEKKGIININLPKDEVKCYPSLLGMLFYNLISNGIKFNQSSPPIIDIDYTLDNDNWIFVVKDNGIGIPQEALETVFNSFNRLNNANEYEGSGIGLSICKRIATLHNGFIKASINKDGGSIITLQIPKII